MTFTTRSWSSTTVLLCAFLWQSCQSNFLSATQEEEPTASISSASAVHQNASDGDPAMRPLTFPSASLTACVPSSSLSTPLLSVSLAKAEEALFTPAAMSSSPTEYDLSAVAMPGASLAAPLDNTPDRASSPDVSRVCESKVEAVLREMPGEEGKDSKPSAKRRHPTLAPGGDLANKKLCIGERTEPDKAKETAKDVRSLSLKTLGEREGGPCVEQREQSGDPLTILLDVASLQPDKAIQFLDVLLVAAQDEDCRQQALEALGKVAQASPDMFSECLPSLRAAAKGADKDVRLIALKTLG
jgi:hypothetical protein